MMYTHPLRVKCPPKLVFSFTISSPTYQLRSTAQDHKLRTPPPPRHHTTTHTAARRGTLTIRAADTRNHAFRIPRGRNLQGHLRKRSRIPKRSRQLGNLSPNVQVSGRNFPRRIVGSWTGTACRRPENFSPGFMFRHRLHFRTVQLLSRTPNEC